MVAEEALKKRGHELFKELLRFYPLAEIEDYVKQGQWREDILKVDIQLFEANRNEAGAVDPPPLSEVKMPDLPPNLLRPPGPIVNGGMALLARPGVPVPPGPPSAATAGPVAELRLIALFVAKWKLDPTRTKTMMAKLTPQRRRYVIQTFKTATPGIEATTELETYIAECEKTDSWAGAAPPPASAATTVPAAAVSPAPAAVAPAMLQHAGVKRPALTPTAPPPASRPRLATPTVIPKATTPAPVPGWSPLGSRLATGFAGGYPQTVGAVRPGLRPAGSMQPMPRGPLTTARPGLVPTAVRPLTTVAARPPPKAGDRIRDLLNRF